MVDPHRFGKGDIDVPLEQAVENRARGFLMHRVFAPGQGRIADSGWPLPRRR